ncbi:AraC family transcriptional regulator [Chitinophaga sp. 212800010-3]|uniref:AraC family transcriptional regulator n=1 Tax=unclassified Chitinophaga TaxID=2619133 RepID=UPI002DEA8781|nr:HTH araC/xylS-type domain-containing protein [Chitinophaga sp. 212800010-3]
MEYLEYPPHPRLAAYIECYWSAFSEKPPFREQESLIPDGTIELMFNFGDDYFHIRDGAYVKIKGAHVIGIRKEALSISQPGRQHFFCIRFKLGGTYPFFGIPGNLFANSFYTVEELLGRQLKELEERLFEAPGNVERVGITNDFLLRKMDTGNTDYLFALTCMPAVLKAPNIADVLRQFNLSYKALERKFSRVLGVSPSELVRIKRFSNAVHAMYSGRFDSLTSIGYHCGYYDQSHFIREFRQMTRFSPREFLKEQFTIVQVIQPALAERLSKMYNL